MFKGPQPPGKEAEAGAQDWEDCCVHCPRLGGGTGRA